MTKKIYPDEYYKKKAIKLVVAHLSRKLEDADHREAETFEEWISKMNSLLEKDEFVLADYVEMRKELNNLIDSIYNIDLRYKVRDSWSSYGKSLDKKAPVK
ncbi:MAG: hypothetical protein WC332_02525 [Clostridia bacterium]|jgi:thiamine kinase-like enzyme